MKDAAYFLVGREEIKQAFGGFACREALPLMTLHFLGCSNAKTNEWTVYSAKGETDQQHSPFRIKENYSANELRWKGMPANELIQNLGSGVRALWSGN
jgi:hypothetical protein